MKDDILKMFCVFFFEQEDLLSVWNRSAADQNCTNKSKRDANAFCFHLKLILCFLFHSKRYIEADSKFKSEYANGI